MNETPKFLEISSSSSSEDEGVTIEGKSTFNIDPKCLDLPGPNWGACRMNKRSLLIYEIAMISNSLVPHIRKYVRVNLSDKTCISYVMDFEISEMSVVSKYDIEQCIEELAMMTVCNGGPSISEVPPVSNPSLRIDTFGNWRHNSCEIVTAPEILVCNACISLPNILKKLRRDKEKKTFFKDASLANLASSTNLSHRQQSQINSLQKRQQNSYRKKKLAEKEIKVIEDMIQEVLEEPEKKHVDDDSESEKEDEEQDN